MILIVASQFSNVIRLYDMTEKDAEQLTYYNSGIGTYAQGTWYLVWENVKKFIRSMLSQMIAWDIYATVLDAYRWLSDNYEPGDRIFMFGFSRGAYQVRILSAMIHRVGLIHKGNTEQIPYAWELYAKLEDSVTIGPENEFREFTPEYMFKHSFCREVNVHFVGVWDTVSSVGLWRGKIYANVNTGMKHVCYFRHALALDERRVKFLPEYVCGGFSFPHQSVEEPTNLYYVPLHTKEVWFAGTHWDVTANTPPPLAWMIMEAAKMGLRLTPFEASVMPESELGKDSLTAWWKIMFEYNPFITRLDYGEHGDDPKGTTRGWSRNTRGTEDTYIRIGDARKRFAHTSISTLSLLSEAEKRRSTLSRVFSVSDLTDESVRETSVIPMIEHWGALAEVKNYGIATLETRPERLRALHVLSRSGQRQKQFGKHALIQAGVLDILLPKPKPPTLSREISSPIIPLDYDSLEKIKDILEQLYDERSLKKLSYADVQPLLRKLFQEGPPNDQYAKAACAFIETYTDFTPVCTGTFHRHDSHFKARPDKGPSPVVFTSFWPAGDAHHVLAASQDGRIRIWNVHSRRKAVVMSQPEGPLLSFAYSMDGHYGASHSPHAVYIWDLHKGTEIARHRVVDERIYTIGFSPYGDLIVSSESKPSEGPSIVSGSSSLARTLQVRCIQLSEGHEKQLPSPIPLAEVTTTVSQRIRTPSFDPSLKEKLWDLHSQELNLGQFEDSVSLRGTVTYAAISPRRGTHEDAHELAALIYDSHIRIYQWRVPYPQEVVPDEEREVEKFRLQTTLKRNDLKEPFVFSPDGRHLLSSGVNGNIYVVDIEKSFEKAQLRVPSESRGQITSIEVSRDNSHVVCSSDDGYVYTWNARSLLTGPNF
ncbi:hypothetical protein NM688_g6273 [Phlebia brevispora]|uniref:Uncharacterized protein n=1 Tax=Phlebia brevispora TaxID=194682 RepID=A0ACC1SHW4_9APHY|nr:hypothetical protein NM688_g6273 [Phlebia brevispora]